jgi:hypothetical protein
VKQQQASGGVYVGVGHAGGSEEGFRWALNGRDVIIGTAEVV